jgi:nitroreductase
MTVKKTRTINDQLFVRYSPPIPYDGDSIRRSEEFYHWADTRRSVRAFSEKPVPRRVITNILQTAGTAPSGAHKQPWTFCAVSDPIVKARIRDGAEKEEYINYTSRMSREWLDDLKKFGTDWRKPFLETAPWLIVVFRKSYDLEKGAKRNNYYVAESVGIACGFLLMAIHHAGLAALTHTPSPMNFLSKILKRPANEKPFLLIPVGYPAEETWVPDLKRKRLTEISAFY